MKTSLKSLQLALTQKYHHKIINGTQISKDIRLNLKAKILEYNEVNEARFYEKPVLGYIMVGNRPDSELYVKLKKKACEEIGIEYRGKVMPVSATEQELMNEVNNLQKDDQISGILVQLPLPDHINAEKVLNLIGPNKDVDGLHPFNIGSKSLLLSDR